MKTTLKMMLMAACAMVLLSGCGEPNGVNNSAATAAPAAPAAPKPRYSIKDGLEYGYEQGISEADRQKGQAAAPITMISYLGRRGDTYQVMVKSGNVRTVAECTKPCEFAKMYVFIGDRFTSKENMRIGPEVLVSAAFSDAIQGHLEQLTGQQKGVATTFWVDGEGKRLIVADASTSGVTR